MILLALILCGPASSVFCASEAESLVVELTKVAKPDLGIPAKGDEIAKKLQAIGAEAIPLLLPLLRSKNEDVRTLASYVLRDMDGLSERDLDALIESRRRGDGWIPPAIARIGGPRAIAFLIEELLRERETETQLTWAITMLGEKTVPRLVEVFQSEMGWDDKLEATMFSVFKELGDKAKSAVVPLLRIAIDEASPPLKRIHAIRAIGAIGLSAEGAISDLIRLRKSSDARIQEAATSAILNIGSADAAPILVRSLEEASDPFRRDILLRAIAGLKTRGKSAGAAVARYLSDEDWEVRVAAARTLGYIGYEEAADHLILLLRRQDDWRLVLSAAESLGRLRTGRALPALLQTSQTHWFPPVREAALAASEIIRGGSTAETKHSSENFAIEFFEYGNRRASMDSLDEHEASSIRFPVAATADPNLARVIKSRSETVRGESRCGAKVTGGYLIGSDRGEWGGEINFIDLRGNSSLIVRENTEAIYNTERGILAVTGLAHLDMNCGFISKMSAGMHGKWTVMKWRALPGAPRFSRLLKDGSVFVSCYSGIVLVSPDGEMKSLSRSESLLPPSAR